MSDDILVTERDGGIAVTTDQDEIIVLRRWASYSPAGVAGMALGSPTPASETGYWWQPLVLSMRGSQEAQRLLPYAQRLYDEGVQRGIVRGERFEDVAS